MAWPSPISNPPPPFAVYNLNFATCFVHLTACFASGKVAHSWNLLHTHISYKILGWLFCSALEIATLLPGFSSQRRVKKCAFCTINYDLPSLNGNPGTRPWISSNWTHFMVVEAAAVAVVQGDTEEWWKPPVDWVPTVQSAAGPLL